MLSTFSLASLGVIRLTRGTMMRPATIVTAPALIGDAMNFWTIDETAKKWGITPRQVRNYCAKGRVYGAILERGEWRIPADAAKPERKSRRPFPTTVLGEMETCPAKNVRHEMAKLLDARSMRQRGRGDCEKRRKEATV